ncbi:MAG: hypothetical protein QOD76_2019 [Solirubrobacteraceae bacterium]|jgi:hypothetical protein|nr:hypothetical protein [Solirubrobacteraceae bacterium]
MARLPSARRVREIPWDAVLGVAVQIAQHGKRRWDRLSQRDQRDLTDLLRASRGRLQNLSKREREDLRRIVWKALGPEG